MTQIQVSSETALRETIVESEQRRNRVMVLAQQLADANAEIDRLRARVSELDGEARPGTEHHAI